MTAFGTKRLPSSESAFACAECGAGLPPPDMTGSASCVYCGTEHRSDRSSQVLAAALAHEENTEDSGYFRQAQTTQQSHSYTRELELDLARIPMTDEAVLGLLRQHFSGTDSVFVCPHVPPRKEQAARRAHCVHLPESERILALFDSNLFGVDEPSGIGTSFVITSRRLCWKNAGEPAFSLQWRDLDADRICLDRSQLFVTDTEAIVIVDDASALDACADAFHVLALSAVPRPTASGVVMDKPKDNSAYYGQAEAALDCACWHCRTPLFAQTPRCAYCGVLPKKRGWPKNSE